MKKIKHLKCVKCGREYAEEENINTCKDCGIEGILDVVLDYDHIKNNLTRESLKSDKNLSLWRYLPAIPLENEEGIQLLQVGWTPLYKMDTLSKEYGVKNFYVKDDSRNPTASLKDRASAVGVAKAIELNRDTICTASTGNAASSLAGFAAIAGKKTYIFVPETAPVAKITQLLIYGSTVFLVKGTYDEATELCFLAANEFGWYNRSCAINPFLVEGKKTVAYEICEQLNWEVPDIVVMAVGDGCSIAAAWKGFYECYTLGLTNKVPRMVGVQAENSNPVTRAFKDNSREFIYKQPDTIADSISVGIPRNGIKALNAIKESNGFMIDVSDNEILDSIKVLARRTGIFGEPAGVTSFAGIRKLSRLGVLNGTESIVSIVTGSGLKDIKSASMTAGKGISINPNMDDLLMVMKKRVNEI